MSTCARCGAGFRCAQVDADYAHDHDHDGSKPAQPCWCLALPPAAPMPSVADAACWCPDCLRQHLKSMPPPCVGVGL